MKDLKVVAGLEIECEYNGELIHIQQAGHNSSRVVKMGKHFISESDGSLRTVQFDQTAEFVSRPFLAKKTKKMLAEFRKRVGGEQRELNELLNFNSSAGCHLNFSVYKKGDKYVSIPHRSGRLILAKAKDIKLGNIVTFDFCKNLSKTLQEKVRGEFGSVFYNRWLRQFYRDYAKELTKQNFHRDRNIEYNVQDKRIEFRSFNLLGVKTWEQFDKLIGLAVKTIEEELNKEFEKNQPFLQEQEIEVAEEQNETENTLEIESELPQEVVLEV